MIDGVGSNAKYARGVVVLEKGGGSACQGNASKLLFTPSILSTASVRISIPHNNVYIIVMGLTVWARG